MRIIAYKNRRDKVVIGDLNIIFQGKDNRGKSLEELKDHLTRVYVKKKRQCLVLFPEGGFLRKRKPISHR